MKKVFAALVSLSAAAASAQAPLPSDHPPVAAEGAAGARSAEELIRTLDASPDLKTREKSYEVASSMGKLYYGQGRFADAAAFFGQAVKLAEPARALYLASGQKVRGALPPPDAAVCGAPDQPLDAQVAAAKKASSPAMTASCARRALEPVLEVERLYGQALFLVGDSAGALNAVERVLAIEPDHSEALHTHANLLLETKGDDVASLKTARSQFARFLELAPTSPHAQQTRQTVIHLDRAISAGGITRLDQKVGEEARARATSTVAGAPMAPPPMPPAAPSQGAGAPPQLTAEQIQAFQNTEVTPEMKAQFAKLIEDGEEHLARGRFDDALNGYRQVMPFQPDNPRLRAGMAWALDRLGRQPMADRVWQVAVSSDPSSLDTLAQALHQKGDADGARALWKKLAESDPGYARKAGLNARIGQ